MNQPPPESTEVGTRQERDSLGTVEVPSDALWGAQTQRAVDNFQISGLRFDRRLIRALGTVKLACAGVNQDLGLLPDDLAEAIKSAAGEVIQGAHDSHLPIDVFQTCSGTSTNMNANEVLAALANRQLAGAGTVHPNDHVNMSQSSNDVIPTAIHVAGCVAVREELLPALGHLADVIETRATENRGLVKTGRTHLMDATPLTVGQEMGAWAAQVRTAMARLEGAADELAALAIGGTAVGTGINAPAGYGKAVAARLSALTGVVFRETEDHFAAQGGSDAPAAMSAAVKGAALALMKISNDLRWMNAGPNAGFAEVTLPALQPGSSIMPGKVNPVIPEAVTMVCAQVIGNDVTISVAAQAANFQLSVMQPVIAKNLLESIAYLSGAARALADRAIAGLVVNAAHISELVDRNPILVTALNPVVGYDLAAKIAKRAYAEGRAVKDVAREMTELSDEDLDRLLDPASMTGAS